MANNTTHAMPTVDEIEAMIAHLSRCRIYAIDDVLDMLRAIADQMRNSEPVAWHSKINNRPCSFTDDPHLVDFWRSKGWPVVPIYATPRADAEDARRYRWLRDCEYVQNFLREFHSGICFQENLDKAIDAAMKEDSYDH